MRKKVFIDVGEIVGVFMRHVDIKKGLCTGFKRHVLTGLKICVCQHF